ncbi:MAG TPA: homoserine kinase [Actinomycetota bacterium]|nr:homoserine kinase [Actinomycetota bacterium]
MNPADPTPFSVVAPASVANLGPGFDCLAAAVGIHLRVDVQPGGDDVIVEGKGGFPRGRDNMIVQAAATLDRDLQPMRLSVTSEIPEGRGLGSSAAAVAAGLLIGSRGRELPLDHLVAAGSAIEGHGDNVAAALAGGIVVAGGNAPWRFDPRPSIQPVFLVPSTFLPTPRAREVLPERVPLRDAVRNIRGASLLMALLSGSCQPDPGLLLEATDDVLHQPYRAPLAPETAGLVARLRSGGVAAAVSGSGPSVVALVVEGTRGALEELTEGLDDGWRLLEPGWETLGARFIPYPDDAGGPARR